MVYAYSDFGRNSTIALINNDFSFLPEQHLDEQVFIRWIRAHDIVVLSVGFADISTLRKSGSMKPFSLLMICDCPSPNVVCVL